MKRSIPPLTALPRPLYNRRESLPPGAWTEEHRHPWCQFSYAISGVLGVRTPEGNYAAPPRYAVWIPPNVPHQVENRRQTEMRSLYLDPHFAAAMPAECRVLEMTPLARALIERVSTLPVEYDEAGADGRLVEVLEDELARLAPAAFRLPLPRDRRLAALCTHLQEHPEARETLEDWAGAAGASARTLSRLFRRETGLTFREWRQRLRLMLALPALEAGESVTRVALAHGYDSPSAFIAAFRSTFGHSPGELVRRTLSGQI